jgi:endonuclease/exonuclease/phosphatase family metal-dependent hydrolase
MRKRLKVVTWNCAMALRRKLREVASLDADVLVLQECSRADAELLKSIGLKLACWTGNNQHKGLALAAKPELKLTARAVRGIQWAIRGATGNGSPLGIVAMWACATENSEERYIRQVHKLLDRGVLEALPAASVFLGDFNSNTIWDRMHRELNHSRAVDKFDLAGYKSAYHGLRNEPQGKEATPTFFLQRNRKKPYHIDYAFLSPQMRRDLRNLEIGKPAAWLQLSDHMPFSIEISQRR